MKHGEKGKLLRKVKKADYNQISWDELRKEIWFPLIAVPGQWYFRIFTTDYLRTEFTIDTINSHIKKIEQDKRV